MDTEEVKKKRAERLARSLKKKKQPSRSANRSKGKTAPGRKRVQGRGKLPKEYILRRQAMNRIKRYMESGNIRQAQTEFLIWLVERLETPNDNWIDVIECELEWTRTEINHLFKAPQ